MVKETSSLCFGIKELKSISICDLFYMVMLDIADPLLETKFGNKYVLVAIDHYSKWCEAKSVKKHTTIVVARFLEEEIVCRFGVLKYVLVDNYG
jgi:hypothetical protein